MRPARRTATQRRFPAARGRHTSRPLSGNMFPSSRRSGKRLFRSFPETRCMARICHKADKFLTRQQKNFFTYTQNENDVNLFIFHNNISILHKISASACFRRPARSMPFLQYRGGTLRKATLLSRKKQRLPFSGDPTAHVHFIQKKKDDTSTQLPFSTKFRFERQKEKLQKNQLISKQ